MNKLLSFSLFAIITISCGTAGSRQQPAKSDNPMEKTYDVRLITLDPGHFHAALVQKTMYPQVSPDVHVYAPEGPDGLQHLGRIKSYNNRPADPTSWNEIIYTGPDYLEKMLLQRKGNVVVLAGNNRKKAEYITRSVDAGFNVFSDKPMIIRPEDFPALETAFTKAKEKGVLLYDIMTERYEVTTILQKLLSQRPEIFGTLKNGNEKEPAVTKLSIHHFSKIVSGSPLLRPAWYFDVQQQGEGIVDVTTHLVDLVQWECFPELILNPADVTMISARRWATSISKEEFRRVTGYDDYPGYLTKDVKDGKLDVYSNGEMVYKLKGVFVKVSVEWKFEAPQGGGDTHYSAMHGTKCDLTIKQGADEKYIPVLYIENIQGSSMSDFSSKLKNVIASLPYDSVRIEPVNKTALKIDFPKRYRVGHEAHFGQVTAKYLEYLKEGKVPEWEVAAMITKYYTTTSALKLALKNTTTP